MNKGEFVNEKICNHSWSADDSWNGDFDLSNSSEESFELDGDVVLDGNQENIEINDSNVTGQSDELYHAEEKLTKDIKAEIGDMVRDEMQNELAAYQHQLQATDNGQSDISDGLNDHFPGLAGWEPKLRQAFMKMLKLDQILESKIKKEKEVKRNRMMMERRMHDEVKTMMQQGEIHKDIIENANKYITLALPAHHDQGVMEDDVPVTPLFQTQIDEDLLHVKHKLSGSRIKHPKDAESRPSNMDSESAGLADCSTQEDISNTGKKKDFVKRNKELAVHSGDVITMTDDEKKRLQELLSDVDHLPEQSSEGELQVDVCSGEGFLPSDIDQRALITIDQQLQSIMPEDDFRSIASRSLTNLTCYRLFQKEKSCSGVDCQEYGEKALQDIKRGRELRARLKQIEDCLAEYHYDDGVSQTKRPTLSEQELQNLLDDCVLSQSHSTAPNASSMEDDRARCLESARSQLMEHPPSLSAEMLQKLLSQAHFPLYSNLTNLPGIGSDGNFEDMSMSSCADNSVPIQADTWKTIAEQPLINGTGNNEEEQPDFREDPAHEEYINGVHPSMTSSHDSAPADRSPSFTYITPAAFTHTQPASLNMDHNYHRSLPLIPTSPLINMPQGEGTCSDNPNQQSDVLHYWVTRSRVIVSMAVLSLQHITLTGSGIIPVTASL